MKKVNVIAEYGVKTDWDKLDEWQQKAHPYTVKLKYDDRQMTIPFFMGSALTHEPTDEDVMICLIADYSVTDETFEEFCANFGYDEDSRKAEKIYKQCVRNGKKIKKLLGPDLDSVFTQYQDL